MSAEARRALTEARTIAVLGASDKPGRAGFYVPEYLTLQGYRVLPINPRRVGETLWGQPVLGSLAAVEGPVDILNVFRAPEHLPGHVDEVLSMAPRPGVVWLQLGVLDETFQRAMAEAGVPVVADRCTMADHRAFGLGSVPDGGW
jgi:predicted CoA-binding protein